MLTLLEIENRIAYLTLNRLDKKNALNFEFVVEIKDTLKKVIADPSCKVIVLKSSSDVFCAGADLAYLEQLQQNTYEQNLADSLNLAEMFQLIYHSPKPVIAQVEGHAIAGGCGLASICDFSFAVPAAKFAYTEVKIGFIPAIVMVFLARKIGEGKARELLLTGKLISSEEAKAFGLINEVVSAEEISNKVKELATSLCNETSVQSLATVKEMLAAIHHLPVDEAVSYAAQMNAKARSTDDCKRGIAAFLNKEKIVW